MILRYVSLFIFLFSALFINAQELGKDVFGMAIVKKNEQYGIINHQGKILIPIKYDEIKIYKNQGVARLIKDDLHGMVNWKGEWMMPMKDWYLGHVDFGVFPVKNKKGKTAVYNIYGEAVTDFIFEKINENQWYAAFEGGFARAKLPNKEGQVILNSNGKILLDLSGNELSYNVYVDNLAEDRATLTILDKSEEYKHYYYSWFGFIDEKGALIVEPKYSAQHARLADNPNFMKFTNGFTGVILGIDTTQKEYTPLCAIINKQGKIIAGKDFPLYDVRPFPKTGLAKIDLSESSPAISFRGQGGTDVFMDTTGKIIFDPSIYELGAATPWGGNISDYHADNRIAVSRLSDGQMGYLNFKGEPQFFFDKSYTVSHFKDGYAIVMRIKKTALKIDPWEAGAEFAYIDTTGKITSPFYDYKPYRYSYGIFPVPKTGIREFRDLSLDLYGLEDANGQVICPPKFKWMDDVGFGFYEVRDDAIPSMPKYEDRGGRQEISGYVNPKGAYIANSEMYDWVGPIRFIEPQRIEDFLQQNRIDSLQFTLDDLDKIYLKRMKEISDE